jgi:alpha-1,6-mannosyltransferase
MAIALLTFLATNARLELALFLLPMTLGLVISGMTTIPDAILVGAAGGFSALGKPSVVFTVPDADSTAVSGPIDYFLWSQALPHPSLPTFNSAWQIIWPELSSMHYNLVQGQSANWGIMSKHYYFSNSLPKLLMGALPLAALGVALVPASRLGVARKWMGLGQVKAIQEVTGRLGMGLGVVGLLGGLSAVGHKEWRFVVYAVPVVNVVAAMTASAL